MSARRVLIALWKRAIDDHPHPNQPREISAEEVQQHDGAVRPLEDGINRALDAYDRHQKGHGDDNTKNRHIGWAAVGVALLALFASTLQFCEMQQTTRETRHAVEESRKGVAEAKRAADAALVQAKAYQAAEAAQLSIDSVRMDFDDAKGVAAAWATIVNSGRIAAGNVKLTAKAFVPVDWRDKPVVPPRIPTSGFDFHKTPVPPGRDPFPFRIPFSISEPEKARARRMGIVLYGEIAFDDGFGGRRETGFCVTYAPPPHPANLRWTRCSQTEPPGVMFYTPSRRRPGQ